MGLRDAIAVGGEALFHKDLGPLLPGALHVPSYQPHQCLAGCGGSCVLRCVKYIDYVLAQDGEVGAVLVETVRNTDVQVPPPAYYQELRAICDKHDALLIVDETAIALGRTGRMFAIEHYGVQPDMIVMGKGLGGGVFPLAALLARAELDIAGETAIGHFTHEKSPVGAAAGLAVLNVLESEGLVERSARLGESFAEELYRLAERFACVGEIRHLGMLFAVDIVHPEQPARPWPDGAEAILYASLSRGLSFKVSGGSTLSLSPPLVIEVEQWEAACRILGDAVAVVMENYR
jgi:4-aminobutyrate aminotransferase